LKRLLRRDESTSRARLSAVDDRGPIEAAGVYFCHVGMSGGFPRSMTAAPLKHVALTRGVEPTGWLSAVDDRGPIEAQRSAPRRTSPAWLSAVDDRGPIEALQPSPATTPPATAFRGR